MNISWLIAKRELKERIKSRSFIGLAISGPILVLLLVYLMFSIGENTKSHYSVLIVDPNEVLGNQIMSNDKGSISYDFVNSYLRLEDFSKGKRFQKYDVLLELNEKIISNKSGFLFYREKPSLSFASSIQFHLERRLEEIVVQRFAKMSLKEYRRIKQPITLGLRDVNNPQNDSYVLGSWVGFFFGCVIIFFILLFGMTILRSVSSEKANRIVEVLLASVKPRQLMLGKIAGIGVAAIVQFSLWVIIVLIGLMLFRETVFPDMFDVSNWDLNKGGEFNAFGYNAFVELVYERIHFSDMLGFFLVFFIFGYVFYGAFFAALGATSGSENDGQQFVLPILFLLLFSCFSGYVAVVSPGSSFVEIASFLPFTSVMVCMVKLAQGYPIGEGYQIFISLLILIMSSVAMLIIAGRLYSNGILQFGHRLRLRQFVKWMRNG